MSVNIFGVTDHVLDEVINVLRAYETQHPHAEIEGYREDSASIRIRIVDPDFKGISRIDRHNKIWDILDHLSEETLNHLSILVLVTPEEKPKSIASLDFDDPVRDGE